MYFYFSLVLFELHAKSPELAAHRVLFLYCRIHKELEVFSVIAGYFVLPAHDLAINRAYT